VPACTGRRTGGPLISAHSSDLDAGRISAGLAGRRVGQELHLLSTAGSTMDEAVQAARQGAPDGTVVIADYQHLGRGRLGRAWFAPPGRALLLSILFRPGLPPERVFELPIAVGLGAWSAIRSLFPSLPGVGLKWPNDLVQGDLKLGGLLSECLESGSGLTVVVGLGLNVHQPAAELVRGATSLHMAGADPRRDDLAAVLLAEVDARYAQLLGGHSLLPDWTCRLSTLGRTVTAVGPSGTVTGRAVAVRADGALVIEGRDGRRVAVQAGDVTLAPG
jgi:BirA family biotin operon repressor/biotin-[acetyl-CoA-carboxylase] ligase